MLLGFDALGRPTLGQISEPTPTSATTLLEFDLFSRPPRPPHFVQQKQFQDFINAPGNPNQFFGNDFGWWPNAPRPVHYARDWIAFSGNIRIEFPVYTQPFSPFYPPPKPPHRAVDWVTQYGNISVNTLPINPIPFLLFNPAPHPRNFAKAWIAFSGSEQTEDFPAIGIDFMPFAPGRAAKLWSRFGQQPQWWAYYFKAPVTPPRDRHDSGDWIPRYRSRRPPVYEDSYYDELRRKWEWQQPEEEAPSPVVEHVPNLLIPIGRLIQPVRLPSLSVSPPYRPVPSLTTNPPEFHMATHDEMATDDEMIIRMLLED